MSGRGGAREGAGRPLLNPTAGMDAEQLAEWEFIQSKKRKREAEVAAAVAAEEEAEKRLRADAALKAQLKAEEDALVSFYIFASLHDEPTYFQQNFIQIQTVTLICVYVTCVESVWLYLTTREVKCFCFMTEFFLPPFCQVRMRIDILVYYVALFEKSACAPVYRRS